jgi:hypothetical protein
VSGFPFRISTPKIEGALQVSKWHKVQLLLDSSEMQELLSALKDVFFVVVSEPVIPQEAVISPDQFLKTYTRYVDLLKRGEIPLQEEFRRTFSCGIAEQLDPFYALSAGNGKFLVKPTKPIIQLQAHHFFYSKLDHQFHPMVFSQESISWGLQFSYPHLFQDPKTRQVVKVKNTPEFPNTALFTSLLRWIRNHSLPTPFEVEGVKTNSPIRIGKKSLSWIKSHPQLTLVHVN